jgi:hypothetical protein
VADEVMDAVSDMWLHSKIEESLETTLFEGSEPLRSRFFEPMMVMDLLESDDNDDETDRSRNGAIDDCIMQGSRDNGARIDRPRRGR